jgi:transposase
VSTTRMMDTKGTRRPRRSWPAALKREIVEASLTPGASVSLIARRYDVNTNQLFSWRRLYRNGVLGSTGPALVPVSITAAPSVVDASPPSVTDAIEIEVPGGYRVRVGAGVGGKALRRVLDALARR